MPPADNVPGPTPVTEPPKKQGFFAKLFGGKKATTPAIPENRESLTPPPRLDETAQPESAVEPTAAPTAEPFSPPVEATPAPEYGNPTPPPSIDSPTPVPTLNPEVPAAGDEESTPPAIPPVGPTPPVQ